MLFGIGGFVSSREEEGNLLKYGKYNRGEKGKGLKGREKGFKWSNRVIRKRRGF